jgi:cytochrome P450
MPITETAENLLNPSLFAAEQGPPHHLFDKWRESDPVHWNPANPEYATRMPGASGVKSFWVLTRHKDVHDVSMNQELFSSHEAGIVVWEHEGEDLERQRANFMLMKPADHNAVKKVIMPPFMPKALAAIAPEIDRLAAEIVDSVADKGQCEFVFDVASRLPIYTFCELMGIPEHLRDQVADYGNALADVESRSEHSLDPMIGLFGLAQELAEEKRRHPDDRLMSAMVNDTTLNLDPMAINQFVLTFAMAGHETTRSTAAHFIHQMHSHPDQYALLRSDFDVISRTRSTRCCATHRPPLTSPAPRWPTPKSVAARSRRATISTSPTPQQTAILQCSKTRTASTSPAPMPSAIWPLALAPMSASEPASPRCSCARC